MSELASVQAVLPAADPGRQPDLNIAIFARSSS